MSDLELLTTALDRLTHLHEAATPAPWRLGADPLLLTDGHVDGTTIEPDVVGVALDDGFRVAALVTRIDAALIVTLHATTAPLIALLLAARAQARTGIPPWAERPLYDQALALAESIVGRSR